MSRGAFAKTIGGQDQNRPDRTLFKQQYQANRKIIIATQSICAICGRPVDKSLKGYDPMSATVDHIIPVSRNGHPFALENLQLTHRKCNLQKSNKTTPDLYGVGGGGNPEKNKTAPCQSQKFYQSMDWRT